VPDSIDDEQAVFTEPLAAACQARQAVTVEGKPYITVLGDGRLGLLTAQVMARLNASVRVIGKHPDKLNRCERWGIQHRLLDDVGLRADQDVVVDCTGSADGLRIAMQMVRPKGTIVLKTTVADQQGVDLSPLVIHEINVVGSRCGPFPDALALLQAEDVDVVSLISDRVRFDRAKDAIKLADRKGMLKVLIDLR
jgi:threonine dehydrogenase-like Zn-dependent dehydrogenase